MSDNILQCCAQKTHRFLSSSWNYLLANTNSNMNFHFILIILILLYMYICWGDTVTQWLALLPHSKKVVSLSLSRGCLRVEFPCSLCLRAFSPGSLDFSHSPKMREANQKLEIVRMWECFELNEHFCSNLKCENWRKVKRTHGSDKNVWSRTPSLGRTAI